MCPIQVSINELPYRIRKDNILLTALWCGNIKPVMDLYLRPFVEELKDLHENGIDCFCNDSDQPINIKVHTLVSPIDSIARCCLQNNNQFNGKYGCSFCLNPGKHIKVGNGYARVYCGGEGTTRTEQQHRRDAEQAVQEDRIIHGVKGVSLLLFLPIFNIIFSFPPEYMHAVLLGVVKSFFFAWFDSSNNERPWYIGSKKNIFNDRLLKIVPSCEITRTPRSLDDIRLFKASEWKNLLLYYSLPCLRDLLHQRYLKHWSLLVFSMHKLLSPKISVDDLRKSESALTTFVRKTESLYGPWSI